MPSSVERSIAAIKMLRSELQGRVDDGAIDVLDQVIRELEQADSDSGTRRETAELLQLIGAAISLIPAVAKFIEYLQAHR